MRADLSASDRPPTQKGRSAADNREPQDRRGAQPNENPRGKDPLVAELESIAMGEAVTGRGVQAKVVALRSLDRMRRKRVPPMPPGWHPEPDSEWAELDQADSPEVRERWYRNLANEGRL